MKTVGTRRLVRAAWHLLRTILAATLALLGLVALSGVGSAASAAAPPPGLSPQGSAAGSRGGGDRRCAARRPDRRRGLDQVIGRKHRLRRRQLHQRPPGRRGRRAPMTPRCNLLAYNLTTGELITSFAPDAQRAGARSPSRRTAPGSTSAAFTTVNGVNRNRMAAFNTATGALLTTSTPTLDTTVKAIAVTTPPSTSAARSPRQRRAARPPGGVRRATGALLAWAPTADTDVQAVAGHARTKPVIVGGALHQLNGSPAYGLGRGRRHHRRAAARGHNQVVRDAGANAAILSLTADGSGLRHRLRPRPPATSRAPSRRPDTAHRLDRGLPRRHLQHLRDHGIVYIVGHAHYCGNIGGFPQTNPRTAGTAAMAFTTAATGTLATNAAAATPTWPAAQPVAARLVPRPHRRHLHRPDAGRVVGHRQQPVRRARRRVPDGQRHRPAGLVRFAVPSLAPKTQGPRVSAGSFARSVTRCPATSARVAWQTNWDRDDQDLTYKVARQRRLPVYTDHGPVAVRGTGRRSASPTPG